MMNGPNTFGPYFTGVVIHEQTEMAQTCWGQYAHNNQVVHHVPYLYANLNGSCAANGQYWLRKIMTELYTSGTSMFPGDEDNGEMGAWFVLSALGLYQMEPGAPTYALGSPLFGNVSVELSPGKSIHIVAEGAGKDRPYVQQVRWEPYGTNKSNVLRKPAMSYASLMRGGTLRFMMSETPVLDNQNVSPQAAFDLGTNITFKRSPKNSVYTPSFVIVSLLVVVITVTSLKLFLCSYRRKDCMHDWYERADSSLVDAAE